MKKTTVWLSALCLPLLTALHADTVTLKSGEKIEGKIVRETDSTVTVRVQVTASIEEEKTFQKADVSACEKESPIDAIYASIKVYKPDPNRTAAPETYAPRIAALQDFLTKFPASTYKAEIQANLAALEQEKVRVDAGEIRYRGQWLSKEEAAERKPEIAAQSLLDGMKELVARQDFVGALNTFDRIEKQYAGTRAFAEAADLAFQLLPVLQVDVDRRLQRLERENAAWAQSLALNSEPKRSQLAAAAKREQDQYEAVLAADDGNRWRPLIPRSENSLKKLKTAIPTELSRLTTMQPSKLRRSVDLSDQAAAALQAKDFEKADALLKESTSLWAQNGALVRLQRDLTTLKTEASKPTPVPSPTPATEVVKAAPKPSATPVAAAAPKAEQSPVEFLKTIPGALSVLGGMLVLFGLVTVVNRQIQKKKLENRPE